MLPISLQSLRARLAFFFAALIAVVLLAFGSAVYVAAIVTESQEDESEAEKEHELRQVRHLLYVSLGVGIPLGGVLAALGSTLMTRRTLRAMSDIVATVSVLAPDSLSQRIPLEQTDDLEIQRLVGSLNHMIARVERAVTGLRRFTQDAAHELRTPLAALRSRLEIALRKSRDAAAFRGLVEETLEELDALHRLVDALLLLARSDAGELPVTNQSVELRALIDEVISLYDAIAAEHAQQLFVDCSPSLVLWTDKLLLSRGLANLVDNACKFTPPGGRIGISAVQQGDAVCIRVSDSGPGISVADSQRIFERFFRGDEHRGRTAGFGLGLSLCREFVGALGGQIELARSPEGGTQASIMVPIR